jgi:uncharacterized protein (TIGR03118 family)
MSSNYTITAMTVPTDRASRRRARACEARACDAHTRAHVITRMLVVVGVALAFVVAAPVASPAVYGHATAAGPHHFSNASFPHINVVMQVSDQTGAGTAITDPDAVNSWGLAMSPTGPLWVANNHTNTATVYRGGIGGAAVTKAGLTVKIPGGAPTGQVFNDTKGFVVHGTGGAGPALFLFASEAGEITGWNPTASPTHAILATRVTGASYKGLTLLHTRFGAFLVAADFALGRVDVFDSHFHRVRLPGFFFHDTQLPKGYAPFNVLAVGDRVYVTYAKQGPDGDEVDGAGLGFVDVYTHFGLGVSRVASRGPLDAPWGLAIAPVGFGAFTGALLVGNFGDGRVTAYQGRHIVGQLLGKDGAPVAIDGLWALLAGTANTGGVGTLWFSAGPDDENHGAVGQLIPVEALSVP